MFHNDSNKKTGPFLLAKPLEVGVGLERRDIRWWKIENGDHVVHNFFLLWEMHKQVTFPAHTNKNSG